MAYVEKAGTVLSTSKDATKAYASVLVSEGGQAGNVEYQAETLLTDQANRQKTLAQLRSDLAAHVRAQRVAAFGEPPIPTGITGTLDV